MSLVGDEWEGTATELLDELRACATESNLPRNASALSRRLREQPELLYARDIEVNSERAGRPGKRLLRLTKRSP